MHCQDAQELYSDYVEGKLERALTVSFENHLGACATCREEVEQFRLIWADLDSAPLAEPPAFFHENIMSRIAQEQAKSEEAVARKRGFWDWSALLRPRAFATGFAALVLVLAGAEVVQTQRASLGPVGWIFSLARPAPHAIDLETQSAKWEANPQGGGTLTLELRAKAGTVNVKAFRGATELYSGAVSSSESAIVRVNLPSAPSADEISLSLSEPNSSVAKTVPVTVATP